MYYILLFSFLFTLGITSFLIPQILRISIKKNLLDLPSPRKVHGEAASRLGGIVFFPAILFSIVFSLIITYLSGYISFISLSLLPAFLSGICSLILLYFVGFVDDLVGVRYRIKFLIQVIAAIVLVVFGQWINNLYGILGIYEISYWIGIPLTLFVIVFIVNAINLIDGIDGLASGLCGIAILFFGAIFVYQGIWIYALLAFSTLGVLMAFFYYNVFGVQDKSHKIFMGDTGSLTMGMIISIMVIKLCQYNPTIPNQIDHMILIVFSPLIVPLFDVVRVVIHRYRNGANIFIADKNHIHHKFLALGISHRRAMIIILFISLFFGCTNLLLVEYININILLVIDILLWTFMNIYISAKIKKKNTLENLSNEKKSDV